MGIKRRIQRFKKDWKSMDNWASFPRRWTRAKKILKPSLFIIGLILAFVPTYLQQISVIRVYEGLSLPDGEVSINLNFTQPEDIHISFPYKIKNSGYYSLEDIRLKVSLRLDYTSIDTGNRSQQVIFSKRTESQVVAIGKTLTDTFYKDYQEFNWIGISTFLNEVDESEEVIVLMDIELSFYLTWVERDWIIITDIDLTSDLEQAGVHSQSGIIKTSNIHSYERVLMPIICIFIYLVVIISFLRFRQGDKTKKEITKLKHPKDPLRHREIFKALSRIIIYTTIIVAYDIFLLFSQRSTSVYSSEYNLRFEIAIWSSIFILILINCMSLLPVLRPKIFKKYSVKDGTRSLVVSFLSFLSLTIWSTTAIISYSIGTSSVVIRDTFISFMPFFVLLLIHIAIKITDLLSFSKYSDHYSKVRIDEERKIRKAPYLAKNREEFNKLIFKAINFITSNGGKASLSQIRSYFEKNHISKIINSGEKLSIKYVTSLVEDLYLDKKEIKAKDSSSKSYNIYFLSPKAENLVGDSDLKKKDLEHDDDTDDYPHLIICPNSDCGYYCQPSWNECPLCNTKLVKVQYVEEEELELVEEIEDSEDLVICPNPKCNYYCQPKWGKCPICNTKLLGAPLYSKDITKRDEKKSLYNNIQEFCIACGSRLSSHLSKFCTDCQNYGITDETSINHCPKCGELVIATNMFCVHCYQSFKLPSQKYNKYTLDDLYRFFIRYQKIYKFVLVFSIHLIFIMLFLVEFLRLFYVIILFDFIDFLLIVSLSSITFLYYRVKQSHIKRERIARDNHYKIKLATVQHEAHEINNIKGELLKKYNRKFRNISSEMINLFKKFKIVNKRRKIYKFSFILMVLYGLSSLFFNYRLFLVLLISGLVFLYPIIIRKDVQYLNNIFRLGIQYKEKDYKMFVLYIVNQLNYI